MARIRDYAITIYAAATASMVCEMPAHASGDLLVAFVNKDTASAFTTPSGWTAERTALSAGAAGGVYLKRAASSSEAVTFSLTSETCCAVVIAVEGVNGTTVADAVSISAASGADDSTLPLAGVGLTPSHNNCLLLHGLSTDSGIAASADSPWINLFAGDAGVNSLCVCYSQQKTAAAITAPNHWAGAADDSRGFMVAVRDNGTSNLFDAYIPLSTAPALQVTPLIGVTGTVDKGTYRAAASIVITSVAGKTVAGQTMAQTTDSGINPFRGSMRNAGASSTTQLNHVELPLTTPVNLTAKQGLIFGTYLNLAPRDYVDTGTAAQGGKYLIVGSSSTAWKAWVVGGQFSKTEKADARNNYLIEVASSDTIYASAGSADMTIADEYAFGSSGYYGAPSVLWNELYLLDVVQIVGGGSGNAFGFEDIVFVVNNGCGILPLLQQAGALATVWAPLKFGGVDATHVLCDLKTFQFPTKADEIDFVDFHVANNKIGIEFHGLANDTLQFSNCLFTADSSYYWRFNSSHSADADINFAGATIVNASVTLRSTVSLTSTSFISCSSFVQNAAVLTECAFTNTKVTSASPADAALITDSSFTSPGTGHAMEIGGTAANMTLNGVSFSNYAASNGSTGNEAIYVKIASGSMTISIQGGSTPSIRTDGCTVTVQNAVTVKVTAKDADSAAAIQNARVLLYATTGSSVTITRSGSTATVSHSAHGKVNNDKVAILGADQGEYNGTKTITVVDANSYSFTVSGTPATPATGTILSHRVILDALSDASGIVQNTAFNYVSDLAVSGRVRKGSSATYYKTSPLSGTIGASGLDITAFLVQDA